VQTEPARPSLLNPAVPADLETVCLKCLEKEPQRRYPTAAALADDLERWLRGEPVQARRLGPLGRTRRWCSRNPGLAALTTALILVLLAGLTGILYQWWKARIASHEAELAQHEAEASDAQTQDLLNEMLPTSPAAPQQMRYSQRLPSIDALRRAEAHFERLIQKRPGDTRVRIALTNVRCTLGTLYNLRGQMTEMEACFQGARDLWEPLARQDPHNPQSRDWLATACYWQSNAAASQTDQGRWVRLLLRADALWQDLAEEQPGNMTVLRKVADCRWMLLSLRSPGAGWEAILPPLEEERALLGKRVGEDPVNTALHKRLALTCLVLGEYHLGQHRKPEAQRYWREASVYYRKLARRQPDDPMVKLSLAFCCSRLMVGQPTDPYYTQAVALLGQAADRLAALARQHPDEEWLRYVLLEAHSLLAVCQWDAGRTAQAEHTFRDQVRPLAERLSQHPANQKKSFDVLYYLLRAAGSIREKKHPAVLTIAREAAALAEQSADTPMRDLESCERLAKKSLPVTSLCARWSV
jgi:hypothetical protein